ncbi:MAG: hypothetical protein CVU01_01950 [Bacteroidetes bacterium HGW-Bacteroidetes-18]|nr:MAG: hypothetical protein CVU01_01950 [Bacteroidetes bacterium HGW-Bacteroidetes-18]
MNRLYNELQTLYNKFPKIEDQYKSTSEESRKLIEKEKIGFNDEFSIFLKSEEVYLHSFIGSNVNVLKKHLNLKSKELDEKQSSKYLELLSENLKKDYKSFKKAQENKFFLKKSDLHFYVSALTDENMRLLIYNAKDKNNYLKELITLGSAQPISIITDDPNNRDVNLNHWNEACFNLCNYLIENYHTGIKRQLTNIWYYLKDGLQDENYYFKMTKDDYIEFIEATLKIKLTNFDKSEFKFDVELRTLNELKKQFEKA